MTIWFKYIIIGIDTKGSCTLDCSPLMVSYVRMDGGGRSMFWNCDTGMTIILFITTDTGASIDIVFADDAACGKIRNELPWFICWCQYDLLQWNVLLSPWCKCVSICTIIYEDSKID